MVLVSCSGSVVLKALVLSYFSTTLDKRNGTGTGFGVTIGAYPFAWSVVVLDASGPYHLLQYLKAPKDSVTFKFVSPVFVDEFSSKGCTFGL